MAPPRQTLPLSAFPSKRINIALLSVLKLEIRYRFCSTVLLKYLCMQKEKISDIIEWAGWIGVVLILGGYVLLSTGIINGNVWQYHVMVLLGSTFVGIVSYKKRNFQPVVMNAAFILFALIALDRIFIK